MVGDGTSAARPTNLNRARVAGPHSQKLTEELMRRKLGVARSAPDVRRNVGRSGGRESDRINKGPEQYRKVSGSVMLGGRGGSMKRNGNVFPVGARMAYVCESAWPGGDIFRSSDVDPSPLRRPHEQLFRFGSAERHLDVLVACLCKTTERWCTSACSPSSGPRESWIPYRHRSAYFFKDERVRQAV